MSKRLSLIGVFLARFKYIIIVTVGVAFVGFIDDNSFLQLVQYNLQIARLRDEINNYNERNEATTKTLHELRDNPRAIEKIARERYFMKADDEDIYVLSDDVQDNDNNNDLNLTNEATQ